MCPLGLGVLLPEGVDRVADGTPVGPGQPVCEGLALESAHVLCVEVLAQQVVGLDPVVVDQDDGGLPPMEEAAEALGHETAGPAAADHGDPGVVEQECVVQVVGHSYLLVVRLGYAIGVSCRHRPFAHQPDSRLRAVEHLGPVHRGEVAVDPQPEAQLGPGRIEAPDDAVDAEALLVPVVGIREEGGQPPWEWNSATTPAGG